MPEEEPKKEPKEEEIEEPLKVEETDLPIIPPEDKIKTSNLEDDAKVLNPTSRARAYVGSNQTVGDISQDKVALTAETYDNLSEFDSTTNYRFTAREAGYYLVVGQVKWAATVADKQYIIYIQKNGSNHALAALESSYATAMMNVISDIIYLAADDYVELNVQHNAGENATITSGSTNSFMAVHKLSY